MKYCKGVIYKKFVLIVLLMSVLLNRSSSAQEMLGISNSNFSGNMGMGLNPSLFIGSPYLYEINALSGDIFLDNDFAYVKRNSSFLKKSLSGESVPEERFGDYYDDRTKNAYGSLFLSGPSIIYNRDKFSWGVHTALRSALSATDVPVHVAKFIKDGFDYSPQHYIRYESTPFRSAAMFWGEVGGTIGKKLYEERNKKYLAGAVTLKLIGGFDGFYANMSEFDYMLLGADSLVVFNATGEYGHALEDEQKGFSSPFRFRGYGFGLDLGITWYRGKVHGAGDCNESAEGLKKYKYRVGLSIIDAGLVMFRGQSEVHSYSEKSMIWPGINQTNFPTIAAMDDSISYHFLGQTGQSQSASRFNIWLPTALSVQMDYCLMPRVYANATLVQAIPLSKYAIVRSSQAAVSVRYETRNFEAAIPLTFYEYRTPHLGVALRYRFFVLGTDRLGSYTGLWNATGFDLFFGFKFNTCQLRKKGGKDPFCPVN